MADTASAEGTLFITPIIPLCNARRNPSVSPAAVRAVIFIAFSESFKAEIPHRLDVLARVAAERDQRLRLGDSFDLGQPLGYQIVELVVALHADDRDEIPRAGDAVRLSDR